MFSICEKMEWNHLPVGGGIYDQHPELLKQWNVIWDERAQYEREKKRKEQGSMPKKPNVKGR